MLAFILGGEVGELPTVYLGVPLGAKSKSMGILSGVIKKCDKKMANWKDALSIYLGREVDTH